MSTSPSSDAIEAFVMGFSDDEQADAVGAQAQTSAGHADALTREARLEVALRVVANEMALPFCRGCHKPIEGLRCSHCGAISSVRGYQVEALIATSSRGRMYLARDPEGRRVALKELAFVQAPSVEDLEAFERESRILRTLDHPSIPNFLEAFQEGTGVDTRLYLAQEYIEGLPLSEYAMKGALSEADARHIATSVLDTLVYLQSLSPMVFHRDIKPANLMLGLGGQVHLVDFGAARNMGATANATQVGTFGYMPVEQLGGIVDATTDLYALGASLCHLLTREEPWKVLADRSLLRRMNVSVGFRSFVETLVEPNRENRFPSAEDALKELSMSDTPSAHRDSKKPTRARRKLRALVFLVMSLGLAFGASKLLFSNDEPSPMSSLDSASIVNENPQGLVHIISSPPGAEVFYEQKRLGITPATVQMPVGQHTFSLRMSGYAESTVSTSLTEESSPTLSVILEPEVINDEEDFVHLSGVKAIQPPRDIAVAIQRRGMDVSLKTKVCVDAKGQVVSAEALDDGGYASYATAIIDTIKATWEYAPRKSHGCTEVTFIYKPTN